MDRITLKSLSFEAKHGYYDQERKEGNRFEVDIIAYGSFSAAALKDDYLDQTFDYQKAEEIAERVMNGEPRKLIETLCSDIGSQVFEMFPVVSKLIVSVRKLTPPLTTDAAYAEITLEWRR